MASPSRSHSLRNSVFSQYRRFARAFSMGLLSIESPLSTHTHTHGRLGAQRCIIRNQPSIETRPIMICRSLLCHCFESLTKPVCMCLCLAGRSARASRFLYLLYFVNGYSVTANQLVYVSTTCNNVDTLYFTCNAHSFSSSCFFFGCCCFFRVRCRSMEKKNELCVFV